MKITIFKKIKDSVYNPLFYKEQVSTPAGTAFGYYAKLILLQALCLTIIYGIIFVPEINSLISRKNLETMAGFFPQELQITIKDGQASSNVTEPYAIPLPQSMRQEYQNADQGSVGPKNIIVIDTTNEFSPERFSSLETFALLTRDHLVTQDKYKLTYQELKPFPDVVIDRAFIISFITGVIPYLKVIIPFVIIGLYIGLFLSSFVGNLVFLLILSLIIWIIMKIVKQSLSYGQVFKLGLYGITGVIIIETIFAIFSISVAWYTSVAIFALSMFINLRSGR